MNLSNDKMIEIINQLSKERNSLNTEFIRIKQVASTLESHMYWEGNASNYYAKKFKDIVSQFEEVDKSMSDSIKYLESIVNNYGSMNKPIVDKGSNVLGG